MTNAVQGTLMIRGALCSIGVVLLATLGCGTPESDAGQLLAAKRVAAHIAVDDTSLYWIEVGSPDGPRPGALMRMPKAGGDAVRLADGVSAFLLAGQTIYLDDGRLEKLDLIAGGAPILLSHGPDTLCDQEPAIAMDADHLYWLTSCAILSVPVAGGSFVVLVDGSGAPISSLAVDSANVYWTDHNQQTISAIPKTGGTVTVLAPTHIGPFSVTVDDDAVYWVDVGTGGGPPTRTNQNPGGAIEKIAKSGGSVVTLAADNMPGRLLQSGSSLLWVSNQITWDDQPLGVVKSISKTGGNVGKLFENVGHGAVLDIAVDAEYLYWSAAGTFMGHRAHGKSFQSYNGDGEIRRIPLPKS